MTNSTPQFVIRNNQLKTVLNGRVWKTICIHIDLKNVGIELYDTTNSSFAYLGFESSSLIYESKKQFKTNH